MTYDGSLLSLPISWLLIAGVVIAVLFVALLIVFGAKLSRMREVLEVQSQSSQKQSEERQAKIDNQLGEITGRMQTMAEVLGTRQNDFARVVTERMDGISHRLGQNMTETRTQTGVQLQKLHERLAVIDKAQSNITDLSGQVTALQQILANKQTRGAFGQGRMEAIIADGLPDSAYTFQATLSNGKRPDCLIIMPNEAPSLVIDAKFPLEGFQAIQDADSPETTRGVHQAFRRDMAKHITDISERYFIRGETQDTAFLFVPSESIFAELHENFEDVIQRAHRARVVIVSPSLLMLSIQVLQAILRDQRVREQAHVIQGEVARLMDDMTRLGDRVENLQRHFGQANKDIDQILTSTRKITSRGEKIADFDLGEPQEVASPPSNSNTINTTQS